MSQPTARKRSWPPTRRSPPCAHRLAQEAMNASRASTTRRLLWSFAAIALSLAASSAAIGRGISGPIIRMVAVMRRLAGGDNHVAVEFTDRRDEVGLMARSVEVFKNNAAKIAEMQAEQDAMKQRAEVEKKRMGRPERPPATCLARRAISPRNRTSFDRKSNVSSGRCAPPDPAGKARPRITSG